MLRKHADSGRVELRLQPEDKALLARTAVARGGTLSGGVALLIDAKSDRAAAWYESFGAVRLLDAPRSLVLPFAMAVRVLADRDP